MDETQIKAVELVRSIRDQMYEETKHMSPDEFLAFITREAESAGTIVHSAEPSNDRIAT
jgi:hypothetical protein